MDRDRILAKLDLLDKYLEELIPMVPKTLEEYRSNLQNKRACERLLHLSLEAVMDAVYILVKIKKLGIPAGDESAVDKLSKLLPNKTIANLKEMKGMRNVLVHHYEEIKDEKVFDVLKNHLEDFDDFKKEVLRITNS